MLSWLLDLLPWWAWLLLAIAAVLVVAHYFGVKWAAVLGATLTAALLYKRGRQEGRADLEDKLERRQYERAEEIRDVAADARSDADLRNSDPERLRESDGFRRE